MLYFSDHGFGPLLLFIFPCSFHQPTPVARASHPSFFIIVLTFPFCMEFVCLYHSLLQEIIRESYCLKPTFFSIRFNWHIKLFTYNVRPKFGSLVLQAYIWAESLIRYLRFPLSAIKMRSQLCFYTDFHVQKLESSFLEIVYKTKHSHFTFPANVELRKFWVKALGKIQVTLPEVIGGCLLFSIGPLSWSLVQTW